MSSWQWQADGDGIYDVQYPDRPEVNDRGRIIAEADGTFCYRGILPTAYPIVSISCNPLCQKLRINIYKPSDGPAGDVLRALGRHPHRSSHLHFMLTAPGHDE